MSVVIPIKQIPTWSYSRLSTFEQCALRARLAYIDRIPEPERPLPPGKTEHANDRGTRIHTAAELFVQGKGPFAPELRHFQTEFEVMRDLYAKGVVSLEGEWATDRDWNPSDWTGKNTWQRLKLDALVFLSDYEAVVIDTKTGKKFGNEVKHNEQCQLYQLNTFLRYPKLEVIHTELWYVDQDELTQATYTRQQGLRFKANWDRRANKMTSATEFPANPNKWSCQWCPYKPSGTGHCKRGV